MIDKYAYHVQHVFDAQASLYTNISFPPVHANTLQRIAYPVCPFQNLLTPSVSPPPPPVSFRGQKHHLLPHPMTPLSWCARSAGPQWFDRVSLAVCTISPQWTLLSACPQPFHNKPCRPQAMDPSDHETSPQWGLQSTQSHHISWGLQVYTASP